MEAWSVTSQRQGADGTGGGEAGGRGVARGRGPGGELADEFGANAPGISR